VVTGLGHHALLLNATLAAVATARATLRLECAIALPIGKVLDALCRNARARALVMASVMSDLRSALVITSGAARSLRISQRSLARTTLVLTAH